MTMTEIHAGETLDDASEEEVLQLCSAVGRSASLVLGMEMVCSLDVATGCFLIWPDRGETVH